MGSSSIFRNHTYDTCSFVCNCNSTVSVTNVVCEFPTSMAIGFSNIFVAIGFIPSFLR